MILGTDPNDVGMWTEWGRDLINLIVAIATVGATVASLVAIVFTLHQANRSRDRLTDERRRLHEIDTLESILGSASSGSAMGGQMRIPTFTKIRLLSKPTRSQIPMTEGFFNPEHHWRDEMWETHNLRADGGRLNGGIADLYLAHFDTVTGDDEETQYPRTILNAIYDEIIAAIDALVSQRSK